MGGGRNHQFAPLSPRENKYTQAIICAFTRWQCCHDQGSLATEIILAQMPEEESVGHHWERPGRPHCLVERLAVWLTGLASLSLTLSCGCTQWKQLIPLFYGEEGGGGLRTDNRALSLEMSAVTLGDCPTGQRHFRKKPRYKMSVENGMKLCDEGNETV